MTRTGNPPAPRQDGQDGQRDRAARELEDALYYLREGCRPCAQRHLTLARRFGATERQIAAVQLAGSSLPGPPPHTDSSNR